MEKQYKVSLELELEHVGTGDKFITHEVVQATSKEFAMIYAEGLHDVNGPFYAKALTAEELVNILKEQTCTTY